MLNLELITPHTVVDTKSITTYRSANVGGIALDNFVVAIDSGQAEIGNSLRKDLENYFNLPIKYLFLTHVHTDHRNGLNSFKDVTLVASRKTIENMPKSVKLPTSLLTFEKDRSIKGDDSMIEFHHVGGHTIGSSVAYFPQERVLFGGDLFVSYGFNFKIPIMSYYQNKGRKTGNPNEYIHALEKFRSMEIDYIIPGHGSVIINPLEEVNILLSSLKTLKASIIKAIQENKSIKDFIMPKTTMIDREYLQIENMQTNIRKKARNRLEHYLNLLKTYFFAYYKQIG
ncbi:MAG: MBL fold metallo-hydrolase [Promethearchaeota archaeon]